MKRIMVIVMVLSFVLSASAYTANAETAGQKARSFWQKLFNYPAKVTQDSATTVAETGKRGTEVVTKETRRVGQVTSGEFDKTKELVVEPLQGTAETAVKAVEETVKIPVEAAKDEPAQ